MLVVAVIERECVSIALRDSKEGSADTLNVSLQIDYDVGFNYERQSRSLQ